VINFNKFINVLQCCVEILRQLNRLQVDLDVTELDSVRDDASLTENFAYE
jgi:hypothetical protein